MEYMKIKECDFLKMLADAGYVEGVLKTPESFINAIGNNETLEALRIELDKSMNVVIETLMNAKIHS